MKWRRNNNNEIKNRGHDNDLQTKYKDKIKEKIIVVKWKKRVKDMHNNDEM